MDTLKFILKLGVGLAILGAIIGLVISFPLPAIALLILIFVMAKV